jgi:hypothetical protein
MTTGNYFFGAVGVVGAILVSGLSGPHFVFIATWLIVGSLGIASYSAAATIVDSFYDELTAERRRVYLFYAVSNFLPILTLSIRQSVM